MKKGTMNTARAHNFQITLTLLLFLCLILPVSSVSSVYEQNTWGLEKNRPRHSNQQKIQEILSIIDETLILQYLQKIVGFGPRVSGTYGCEKAAQYIHQQFTEDGLITRYQNWTGWGNRLNFRRYSSQNIEGILPGNETRNLPVIILSAQGSVEVALESIRLGAFDYFPKPINIELLKERVLSLVKNEVCSIQNNLI